MIRIQFMIVVFAIVLFFGSSSVFGQNNSLDSEEKKITIKMSEKPLFDVFSILINKYNVEIGFEESTLDIKHDDYHFETNIYFDEQAANIVGSSGLRPTIEDNLITLDFVDADLTDVVNSIVGQMHNYTWEISNDVVNVFPKRGRNADLEKLLDLKIAEFAVTKGARVEVIRMLLFRLPEFNAFLSSNGLRTDSTLIAPWYNERPLPEGMHFFDLTFKDLLNNITKHKRGGWILKTNKNFKVKDKKFIDLLI